MVGLSMLIVPIVLSAVIVFVVSALVWMVLPHHKTDWRALPNEEAVRSALNAQKARPGMYMIPAAEMGGRGREGTATGKKGLDWAGGVGSAGQPRALRVGPLVGRPL